MNGIDRRALLRGLVSLPALIPAATLPAAASEPLRPDLDGLGMVYLDGRRIAFDMHDFKLQEGDEALMLEQVNMGFSLIARKIDIPYHPAALRRGLYLDNGAVREAAIIGRVVRGGRL